MKNTLLVGITLGIISAIIVGVVAFQGNYTIEKTVADKKIVDQLLQENYTEIELDENLLFDFEAHDLVRLYQGDDNKGPKIIDLLNSHMFTNYPDINEIVQNPHHVEWYNFKDEEKGDNITVVGYIFKTFKEDSEYIWQVNKTDNSIIAKNESAQKLLDAVNSN